MKINIYNNYSTKCDSKNVYCWNMCVWSHWKDLYRFYEASVTRINMNLENVEN